MKRLFIIILLLAGLQYTASAQRGHGHWSGGHSYGGHSYYHARIAHSYNRPVGGFYRPHYVGGRFYARPYVRPFYRPFYRPLAYRAFNPFWYAPAGLWYRPRLFMPFPVILGAGLCIPPVNTVIIQERGAAPANGYSSAPSYRNSNDASFDNLLNTIAAKRFDSERLAAAKIATHGNNYSSEQIKEIMMAFANEDSKLEFAEYAFPYVSDKNNYAVVTGAFQNPNSSTELENYISRSGY